jgi:NTE family protein
MQASSAVPALRKPIEIKDKLFVDGGVLANVPVPHARAMGGDIVIAVQIDERFGKEPASNFRKIGSVTRRMVKLQLAALDSFYERGADIVIHPNVDGISLISTKISDAKKAVAAGEVAGKAAIPAIKQKLTQIGMVGLQQAQ